MRENDEFTASDLLDTMEKQFGKQACKYSTRTLARARQDLWWTFSTARYCQAIREGNKNAFHGAKKDWLKENNSMMLYSPMSLQFNWIFTGERATGFKELQES